MSAKSAIKNLVSGSDEILEIRENVSTPTPSSCEVEVEITGEREILKKLKAQNESSQILQRAVEKAVIDGVATVAYRQYTTLQSLIRVDQYAKFVAMRVELQEILRRKNWILIHRQQGEGFKPQWLTHVWQKQG